jgi:hypothetical protein
MYLSINRIVFDENIHLIKVGSPSPGILKGRGNNWIAKRRFPETQKSCGGIVYDFRAK